MSNFLKKEHKSKIYNNKHNNKRLWLLLLSRSGIAFGGILLVGIVGGAWRLWNFVHKELTPLAQKGVTTTLNRPVNLGGVTGISLSGVRFGASAIPATPTDPDRVAVDAVEVGFDPLQLLFNRRLKLDVTLVNANVYVEQDEQGPWISTTIKTPSKGAAIKTELDKLRFRDGQLVLVPNLERTREQGNEVIQNPKSKIQNSQQSPPRVAFSQVNGVANILEKGQLVGLDLTGLPNTGGNISVKGDLHPKTLDANLQIQGQDLLASDISNLVKLPLDFQAGRFNGNLRIQGLLTPKSPPPLLFGSVDLQQVQGQIPKAPLPFVNSQGTLRFHKTEVKFENITTNYGKIPLVANGIIDSKTGYKLAGRVNAVNVVAAQETLNIKLPVPIAGEAQADLQLLGQPTTPILSGTVSNIKPVRIDKVDFDSASGKFEYSPTAGIVSFKDIQGKAKVGGDVTGTGTVDVGTTPNAIARLNFNFTSNNVPGDVIASLYNSTPPAFKIGTVSGTAQITGTEDNAQTLVKWQAPQAQYPATGEAIVSADKTVSFRNVALSVGGGTVQAFGKWNWNNQNWQAVADASQIQVERFVNPKQLQNVSLNDARFNGRFILSGASTPFKIADIRTENAKVQVAGGTVAVSNIKFGEKSFSTQLVADGVRLGRLLKQSPTALQGVLAGNFQVSGNPENFDLKSLKGTGTARVAVGGGTVTANNIQLANGVYQTQLLADDVQLQQVAQVPQQFRGNLTGQFNVTGSAESFQPQAIQATGQARVNIGRGSVSASNIQVANGVYQAQLQANNVPLQQLAPVPQQFNGNLSGQLKVAGSVDSFQPQSIKATGQGRVNVAGGTVTATDIQMANGRYQAVVNAAGVELNKFSQQLEGKFGGKLQVAGNAGNLNLSDVRATGQVQLSKGVGGIERPLTAVVGWNGEKLLVERATAPGLNASGYISASTNKAGIPEITDLNLNVQAKNYNLQQLPLKSPVNLAGKVDFSGQINGKLPVPNVQGQVALRDLTVDKYAFEPVLSGNVQSVQGVGLNLNVAGTRDKIALDLDANNHPKSFAVKWQDVSATGQTQGDNLGVKVENLPLAAFNLPVPANTPLGDGAIAGSLTGDLLVNQKTLATAGNIAIAKPQVGRIKGDRLQAQFRYEDGTATITDSAFFKGNSRYAVAGTFKPTTAGNPQIKGKLTVSQGEIQDILTALQIFDMEDFQRGTAAPTYGKASDLQDTVSVGLPDQPLFTQMRRLSEINALLAKQQQQRRDTDFVPELADLKGTFNGEVAVDTATTNGVSAQFNLNGQNFVWGREDEQDRSYRVEQIIAQGSFENGVFRLLPLRIESKNSLIAFTGNVGGTEQSGQLRVSNFPLEQLNNFVKLPVGFSGNLNATATLAGSKDNPQAKGELQIANGTLNQKGIESAAASFDYNNGRWNFSSNVMVSGSEPVNIIGSIPYKLPFATVAPNNNQISLDVKVKNEGLAVLNLLTDQVAFERGEGDINLKVGGTIEQPVLNGIATVKGGIFSAQALPEKLTDVTGKVLFDFDRIKVETLQGRFSKGFVAAQGEIPIFTNQQKQANNPLNVSLNQLAVNLKGRYQGGVSGNLQITGSALNPVVGGNLNLANGQVLIAESANAMNADSQNQEIGYLKANKQNKSDVNSTLTQFKNLQLVLGKNVDISLPPILSFRATGSLNVNGSLSEPEPEGTIRLKGGDVNLFTTQFNLVRGYENMATFRGNQNPDLDIRLIAKVLDVNPAQMNNISPVSPSEINDGILTNFEPVDTVRVEARIEGPANQLNENLELTSNPRRSETEIVALLGGSFVETLGRGDSTLGLVNLAGSALNLQRTFNQIGNAFGLSELRIFPTITSDNTEEGTKKDSSVDLAAEAGVDVSENFSVSALKVLTSDKPTQFGINYRITPEIRLRTSTDLDGDNRAVLEYDRRF